MLTMAKYLRLVALFMLIAITVKSNGLECRAMSTEPVVEMHNVAPSVKTDIIESRNGTGCRELCTNDKLCIRYQLEEIENGSKMQCYIVRNTTLLAKGPNDGIRIIRRNVTVHQISNRVCIGSALSSSSSSSKDANSNGQQRSTELGSSSSDRWKKWPGIESAGSKFYAEYTTLEACQVQCLSYIRSIFMEMDCVAMEFDSATKECYLHHNSQNLKSFKQLPAGSLRSQYVLDRKMTGGCQRWAVLYGKMGRSHEEYTTKYSLTNLQSCKNYCEKTDLCVGIDFGTKPGSTYCDTFRYAAEILQTRSNPDSNQYRLDRTCPE